ncbi:hypothetical protein [Kitasatospora sp. NPDC087315]|uniref:hypothetical protein n=1 Tax=Kitasatospora sp. NPDC087315 TaxID=3364069 RepID=UPI003827C5D0
MAGQAAPSDRDLGTVTPFRRRSDRPAGTDHGTAAQFWEQIYAQQGRTLRDIGTADPHRIALATFALLLDGAEAEGQVPPTSAAYLKGMLIEAIQAPDQL